MKNYLKELVRTTRVGGLKCGMGYLSAGKVVDHLRTVSSLPCESSIELHVLGGRTRVVMALWMILSWFVSRRSSCMVVFHDDGTLTSADKALIQDLLPSARVIMDSESSEVMDHALAGFPLCLQCRNLHPMSRKLFDYPVFGRSDKIFSVDTDILFFAYPAELIANLVDSSGRALFMKDVGDCCLLPADEVFEKFGGVLTPGVNAGFVVLPKRMVSFETLEDVLTRTDLLQRDP